MEGKTATEGKKRGGGAAVKGFGCARPKIRREMRKKNDRKRLAKLGGDATITRAGMRRWKLENAEK